MRVVLSVVCSLLSAALCFCSEKGQAQGWGDGEAVEQGVRYIEWNTRSLDKLNEKVQRQQTKMLQKLKHKEARLLSKLKKTDSATAARLSASNISFDSLSRKAKPDSASLASIMGRGTQGTVDSLRRIQSFVQAQATKLGSKVPELSQYTSKLNGLEQKANYQQQLSSQVDRRLSELKGLSALNGFKGKLKGLTGIEKNVFYAKSKIKAYKKMADDPSKLEEKALEYLQGIEGFDGALSGQTTGGTPSINGLLAGAGSANTMGNGMTVEQLEKMGYQTKRQLNAQLQNKFGNQMGGMQQNLASQVQDYQQKAQSIKGQVKETANTINGLKNIEKPSFKVNPMRGKPFLQRLEKGYNLQPVRADGIDPARLEMGGFVGFKHTPKWSYGVGAVLSTGLGKDWNHIRLSLEGVGLRSYLKWEWQYGFALYGGYERLFKKAAFSNTNNETAPFIPSTHNTAKYSESALLGIQKSYRINSRWNGAVQLLYDVWWREKGLSNPLVVRLIRIK